METVKTHQATPPLPITAPFRGDLTPAQYLTTVLEYIADLNERPAPDFTREVAALEEVITHAEGAQQARYDYHRARLLCGAPLDTATQDELSRATLVLLTVGPEAAARLLRECGSDAEVETWINRETKLGLEKASLLAPVLREALESMTPEGAARAAVRRRQNAPRGGI